MLECIYWQENDAWLGYLEQFSDYWTQGESLNDLIEHLKGLYLDLTGVLPEALEVNATRRQQAPE
jgi:predicted RNase H-like HicB family nuclease